MKKFSFKRNLQQETKVVNNFIEYISKYKNFTQIKPLRGKKYEYLVMIMDYSNTEKAKIDIRDNIEKMIDQFE